MTKAERQSRIIKLLRRRRVRTQGDLTKHLATAGVTVDQSTLSRDLSEIGVGKSDGCYVLPAEHEERSEPAARFDYGAVVNWYAACGPNMIVISTSVGQAQPVAIEIEHKSDASILATLAGDDTIYLATRTRRTQGVAMRRLKQWFGDKKK